MLDTGSFAVSLHPSMLLQHQIHSEEIGLNVRILLEERWEHKGCLESVRLGGSWLILRLLEVGKSEWCSAFSGSHLRLISYTSMAPSISEASPSLKGTEICCGNLACSCRLELPQPQFASRHVLQPSPRREQNVLPKTENRERIICPWRIFFQVQNMNSGLIGKVLFERLLL